jgi:hypothetical protein
MSAVVIPLELARKASTRAWAREQIRAQRAAITQIAIDLRHQMRCLDIIEAALDRQDAREGTS